MKATKIHEWSIAGQPAELWIVNGKLQIRHRGTIHNTGIPLDREIEERKAGKWIEDGYHNLPCVCSYCGHEGRYDMKFCPNCGAEMECEE